VPHQFAVEQRVEVYHANEGRWYRGEIATCNTDGTYRIAYTDGDVDNMVHEHEASIRLLGAYIF
jgi:hypothetical protein